MSAQSLAASPSKLNTRPGKPSTKIDVPNGHARHCVLHQSMISIESLIAERTSVGFVSSEERVYTFQRMVVPVGVAFSMVAVF
jgi:hypothetical protein